VEYQVVCERRSTTKTLHGINKSVALERLTQCLIERKLTEANNWAIEIFISGLYVPLWDCIFQFYFKHINYQLPNLLDHLYQKLILFNTVKKQYGTRAKNISNNQELRNHLAETISLLCVVPHTQIVIPEQLNQFKIDEVFRERIDQIMSLSVPYLHPTAPVTLQYRQFIISYYADDLDNCIHIIDWFVCDTDNNVKPFEEFKVPGNLATRSMWLIWKFLISQTTIKSTFMPVVDILSSVYLDLYKRQQYETCSCMLSFLLVLAKYPDRMKWTPVADMISDQVIYMCAVVNLLYQDLDESTLTIEKPDGKKESKTRASGKGKEKEEVTSFFTKDKNIEYLNIINDPSMLTMAQTQAKPKPIESKKQQKEETDDPEIMVINLGDR
jgi:hypothetical protein